MNRSHTAQDVTVPGLSTPSTDQKDETPVDGSRLYRSVTVLVGVIAVAAIVFGTVGMYTVLTASTDEQDSDLLGSYQCTKFDGDPAVAHESELSDPPTVVGDSQLASFETNATAAGVRIDIVTSGALINASAVRPDGTEVAVERQPDANRLLVTVSESGAVRLFIDSLNQDGVAVRSQIDICPPEDT